MMNKCLVCVVKMSFKKYSDLYLQFKKHEVKPSTFDKYENTIKNRFEEFTCKEITDIKPSDIKLWLYNINDVGNKSKRGYLGVLGGIFQEALYDEVIARNPVRFIRLPKVVTATVNPFTSDEVKTILEDAKTKNTNYLYYVAIAFYTGMRTGEIIGLKKSDIDLKNRIINISRSRSRFGESTPKTKYSTREIPILDSLFPYITDLMLTHDNEYLFVTQYGKPYYDTKVFCDHFWTPALKDLKIPYRRPYNMRHTYATNMLYRNLVTPVQLSQLLGHSNTQMVFDIYVSYLEHNYTKFDRSISVYS